MTCPPRRTRARREHALEGSQGLLGAVFLMEAQGGIHDHHDQDHHRVLQIPDGPGEQRRTDQNKGEHVAELIEELEPDRAWLGRGQPVRAETQQALGRLRPREARACVCLDACNSLHGCERVPGRSCGHGS